MTEPAMHGLVEGLDENIYHAHPALSASGAKRLLPPSCPARFKWERDNGGRPNKREFDVGHAAHAAVLGVGLDLVVVDAADWRTKAAKEQRDAAYAEGKCPILAAEKAHVDAMAAALLEHPVASALLDPDHGRPEVSLFWHDDVHDVSRRVRLDWLRDTDGGRLILVDYKSTASAEPSSFGRSAFNFGYDLQSEFYKDGAAALDLAEDLAFVFVAQEVAPPYLVSLFEFDYAGQQIGRQKVDRALQVFAECSATDTWPGYSSEVELIAAPPWMAQQFGVAA